MDKQSNLMLEHVFIVRHPWERKTIPQTRKYPVGDIIIVLRWNTYLTAAIGATCPVTVLKTN